MVDNDNVSGVKIILEAQGLPGAVAVVDNLQNENTTLKNYIRSLVKDKAVNCVLSNDQKDNAIKLINS